MDGARADHDEEAVILLCDDLCSVFAALDDGLFGVCGDGEFGGEELRWDERVVAEDWCGRLALDWKRG
jgi:hypothetical protein